MLNVRKVLLATIPLHKCLLSNTSEYFRNLFSGKWRDSNLDEISIEIPGLSDLKITRTLLESYVANFFEIFYFRTVKITKSNMMVFHRLSYFFLVKESVRKEIDRFVLDRVNCDNYRSIMAFDSGLVERHYFMFHRLQDEEDFKELGLNCQLCFEKINFSDNFGLHQTLKILLCETCNKYHNRLINNQRYGDIHLLKNSCVTCSKVCTWNETFSKSKNKLESSLIKWTIKGEDKSGIYRVVCDKCKKRCCTKCQKRFGNEKYGPVFTCIECTNIEKWKSVWSAYPDALRLGKIYLLKIFTNSELFKREQLEKLSKAYFHRFMEGQSSKKLNELARAYVDVISIDDDDDDEVENYCKNKESCEIIEID